MRMLGIDFIDPMHDSYVEFAHLLFLGRTIDARPIHTQQLSLTLDVNVFTLTLNHGFT
jgi:hypothetical protein